MPVEFRSATSAVSTTVGEPSMSISPPSGVVAGDVMLAVVASGGGTDQTITPPAGWTLVPAGRENRGVELATAVYVRVVTSSEPASYTWTRSSGGRWSISIAAYSGCDTADPLASVSAFAASSALTATYVRPTSTAGTAEQLYVTLMGMYHTVVRTVSPVTDGTERMESGQQSTSVVFKSHIQDELGTAAATAKNGNYSGTQQYNAQLGVMLRAAPAGRIRRPSVGMMSA